MVFEFMDFLRVLPDTFQARTVTRLSRNIMSLVQKETKLIKKLDEAEGKGSIKKVEGYLKDAAKDEIKELQKLTQIGMQEEVLELHETQRLKLLNEELKRIGGKIGTDKVRRLIDAVNGIITKLKTLETSQMGKFAKLGAGGGVWTGVVNLDEGSTLGELRSIGVLERRLVKKIQRLEKQTQNISAKINRETRSENISPEAKKLEDDINSLRGFIDKELTYLNAGVNDEVVYVIYLVQKLKKLEARTKKYVQEGFPEAIAAKLNAMIAEAFDEEIRDMRKLVDDYRLVISQAERAYAKAA